MRWARTLTSAGRVALTKLAAGRHPLKGFFDSAVWRISQSGEAEVHHGEPLTSGCVGLLTLVPSCWTNRVLGSMWPFGDINLVGSVERGVGAEVESDLLTVGIWSSIP